jgi:hypothetical protein
MATVTSADLSIALHSSAFSAVRFVEALARQMGMFRAFGEKNWRNFSAVKTWWRRERDSNPRYGFPYIGFQDRLFQPLTHPSGWAGVAKLIDDFTLPHQVRFSYRSNLKNAKLRRAGSITLTLTPTPTPFWLPRVRRA